MNNYICCKCLECDNEFLIYARDLLNEHQESIVGDAVWCGACDKKNYECYWGVFYVGASDENIGHILRYWRKWTASYGIARSDPRT